MSISLIIHTKNEENNIKNCIASAKDIVDQIIVVDMESHDKTREIAKKLGAEVYIVKDNRFVDDYRNFGISKARFKWILSLDADELLTDTLRKTIQKFVNEDKYDVIVFPFKNIRLRKWMKHTGWWPDYHPRLYKKGYLKWPMLNQAHIMPIIKGRIFTLSAVEKNAIVHKNVNDMKTFFEKMINYYLLNKSDDYFKKRKITLANLVNYYEGEFKWRFIEEKGYLDGTHGFVFSKLREYAKFMEFINWWEKQGYPEIFDSKELLKFANNDEHAAFNESKIYKLWRKYHKIKETINKYI